MKKFLILLIMPLLVFGQPIEHSQNNYVSVEFKMEINMQPKFNGTLNNPEIISRSVTLLVNLEIPLDYYEDHYAPMMNTTRHVPRHLNSFTLSQPFQKEGNTFKPQERLDQLLALNDPEFPKENMLINGLSPVRYKALDFGGAENMPAGFGPKIVL